MNQETTAASTVSDSCSQHAGARDRCKSLVPEYLEELVGSNSEDQNWRGMLISLFVILAVCGLVALSVILLAPDVQMPIVPKVSLNDIMNEKWKTPKHTWLGSDLIYTDVGGNVVKISSSDDEPEILIPNEILTDNGIVDYKISKNGKYALLIHNRVPIYTHSYNASYYVYNIKTRNKELLVHDQSETTLQFSGFGPRGNSIVYSFDGDLFYKANVGEEARILTSGGQLGIIQNGIADWLYEEEILQDNVAHWWSPSGRYLAYATFDDRMVEDSYVTIYNGENAYDVISYNRIVKYKYPKAGRTNPLVSIHVVEMSSSKQTTFIKPTLHRQRLDTFHSLTWLNDDELLITWSNRTMSASLMQQCFPTIATCMDDVIRRSVTSGRVNSKSGWLSNLDQQVLPSDDAGVFFYILPSDHGGMGEFNHLALVNKTEKPSTVKFLTSGNWEVTKLLHYDATTKDVFYISNERHPGSRHVFGDQQVLPSDDAGVFFYILPSDHGGMGEFNHLALVNKTEKPSTVKFLTSGNWEVTKLLHYNATTKDVFYISNERHPGSRHVFGVNLKGEKRCLTCSSAISASIPFLHSDPLTSKTVGENRMRSDNLTCGGKNKCRYYDASVGRESDWLLLTCMGPCLPYTAILRLPKKSVSRGDKIEVDEVISHTYFKVLTPPTQSLSHLLLPLTRYGTVQNNGVVINVKMLVPASIHVGKRPVVFFKGDVGTQTVDFRFGLDIAMYIVTNIGAVGVFVDGRGSGNNGDIQLQSVAGKPGVLEVEDIKAVLGYLSSRVNIDVSNVGVVGTTGYGGYVAAMSLNQHEFRCGVAHNLVSDWKLYNSFGSERILGSPAQNPLLYQKFNLNHLIEGISGSRLKIYHGMQNRKVNMQHSVLLEQSAMLSGLPLDAAKVTFHPSAEEMLNPEEARKIESNIYESISLFLRNCLLGNSEVGKLKLDLLESNYGIPT